VCDLREPAIPLEARIVALCDVFDALTSQRPYKEAWPVEKAVALLQAEAGKHFDPALVTLFLDLLPRRVGAARALAGLTKRNGRGRYSPSSSARWRAG